MESAEGSDRTALRVLRFLAKAPAIVEAASSSGSLLLRHADEAIAVKHSTVRALARSGRIVTTGDRIGLAAGLAGSKEDAGEAFRIQHGERVETQIVEPDGLAAVRVNSAESPLGQLARYKLRDGTAFLTDSEFEAGERQRSDYTRGRVMPRLGANWEASVAPGRRGTGGGLADITDAALAARQRVDHALIATGPELGGLLVDVCCFLKGLELVERERGWPVRSAKVVLKTALGALNRHYRPPVKARSSLDLVHWGSDDYRPEVA